MHASLLAKQINDAIGAHGMWKMRLRTAISSGSSDIDVAQASHHAMCTLGKWLEGPEIDATMRASTPYRVVHRLHAEFHRQAGDVLKAALAGNRLEAERLMAGPFAQASETLVRALTKWKGEAQLAA